MSKTPNLSSMHDVTEVSLARKGSKSLKTTVPFTMVQHMKLTEDDKLRWEYTIVDGEIVEARVTREKAE